MTPPARPGVLRRPVEFEAVLRAGVRVSSANFVARALRNTLEIPRLGLIAGKKAAARAVDRNRAKRLIREIFRARATSFGPFDVTIQLRTNLRGQNNPTVRTELCALLDTLARRCRAKLAQAAERASAASPAAPNSEGGAAADPSPSAPHRQQ